MISDELARQLHDQVSRGEVLSTEQRAELDAWLANEDRTEAALLAANAAAPAAADLRAQIRATLGQVEAALRNSRELTAENELLRRETAALRNRLAARPVPQPA